MTSIDNWKELKNEFVNHFGEESEVSDSKLRYEKSGEFLEVSKNGKVEAGMPLHGNVIQDVKELKFRESEVEVVAKNSSYIFRR